MNGERSSDNSSKLVYQISLNTKTLGLVNPYLFVEKLKEKLLLKVPNIKVSVIYHTKGQAKEQPLVQLKCFSFKSIPDYEIKSIRENISFLAFTLEHELNNKIEKNRSSVA